MAEIVVIGEDLARADAYGLALTGAGYSVEIHTDMATARQRLNGAAACAAVIDVTSTDGGPGLLVGQTRVAWPDCRIVALMKSPDSGTSKLLEMGLWQPDLLLAQGTSPKRLIDAVTTLVPPGEPGQT